MKVSINGKATEIENGATIEKLILSINVKLEGVAVELNKEIVPRTAHRLTIIKENDSIEIIRMTGGG
ncbi:MAG: sulfur carrier protein ThiS [Thermodesulfobacteriota bacterium]